MLVQRLIEGVVRRIRRSVELNRYNDLTIGDYFRKQGAVIGENCRFAIRSLGPEPFLIEIGSHCTITANVIFVTHDGAVWLFADEVPGIQRFGRVVVKDNCFVGINAILMPNVTIGPNSIVGAGAVVTKDVPPNTVVAGNPAKVICSVETYRKKVVAEWAYQKPPGYLAELKEQTKYELDYVARLKNRDSRMLRDHLANILKQSKVE